MSAPKRDEIEDFVRKNPGTTAKQILRGLNAAIKYLDEIKAKLSYLVYAKKVTKEKRDKDYQYYHNNNDNELL